MSPDRSPPPDPTLPAADQADRLDLSLTGAAAARAAWAPDLSILIPSYDCDLGPLGRTLMRQIVGTGRADRIELVVLNDGNPALASFAPLLAEGDALGVRLTAAVAPRNLGRSRARNRLAALARGRFLVFLDADGLPDPDRFVATYLEAIGDPAVILCGGRSDLQAGIADADARLYQLHCRRREWLPAERRNHAPEAYFLSANFCVARELYLRQPFDEDFVGWGWEDTEWAIRASGSAVIRHIDNTVSHLERHTDLAWLTRLERSVANYQRLYTLHPDQVRRHRLFRLIRLAGPLGRRPALRRLLRALALWRPLPAALRLTVLKVYQAAVYAQAIGSTIK